jgi:hypothetical protein
VGSGAQIAIAAAKRKASFTAFTAPANPTVDIRQTAVASFDASWSENDFARECGRAKLAHTVRVQPWSERKS